ncbi:helix-turn-helix transcriptional regulator [Roseivivax marinus]|uniref:helix-turn-helix transcriptional regulator n=1 Tax=Roseivivax marinus TaxID=1379903 RepID=UPI0009DD8CB0|nr:helix-turn-helix transcriptional regulator [Roseivivax marinus]
MTRLASYLKETGLTQDAFAQLVNVRQPTVHRWLHGTASPSWKTAAKIEKLTDGAVPVSAWAEASGEAQAGAA